MSPESTVRALWESFERRDWDGAEALLGTAATFRWPASGESFMGRDAIVAVNRDYPGDWHIGIDEVLAVGGRVVARVTVTLGGTAETCVGFYTVRDGQIAGADEWWVTPYDAPPWRRADATGKVP